MATFAPVIVTSSRRKDGSFTISIRVYHRGQTRRADRAEMRVDVPAEANAKVIRDTYDGIRGDSST